MSTAIAGLVGVIAGSLLSGGVQWILTTSDRRREGRTAARMLRLSLGEAAAAMAALRDSQDFDPPILDWAQYGGSWKTHQERATQVLDTDGFNEVAFAFSLIERIAQTRAQQRIENAPGTVAYAGIAELVDHTIAVAAHALDVLYRAGLSPRETLKRRPKPRPFPGPFQLPERYAPPGVKSSAVPEAREQSPPPSPT